MNSIYKTKQLNNQRLGAIFILAVMFLRLIVAPIAIALETIPNDTLQSIKITELEQGEKVIATVANQNPDEQMAFTQDKELQAINLENIEDRFLLTFDGQTEKGAWSFAAGNVVIPSGKIELFQFYRVITKAESEEILVEEQEELDITTDIEERDAVIKDEVIVPSKSKTSNQSLITKSVNIKEATTIEAGKQYILGTKNQDKFMAIGQGKCCTVSSAKSATIWKAKQEDTKQEDNSKKYLLYQEQGNSEKYLRFAKKGFPKYTERIPEKLYYFSIDDKELKGYAENKRWGYDSYYIAYGKLNGSLNFYSSVSKPNNQMNTEAVLYEIKPSENKRPSNNQKITDSELDEPEHYKRIIDNDDGTFTLQLDVKGAKKEITQDKPMDIILLMDTSWSMMAGMDGTKIVNRQDFEEKVKNNKNKKEVKDIWKKTRFKVTYDATKQLIDTVCAANEGKLNENKNRIAMVKFNNDAEEVSGFSYNKSNLVNKLKDTLSVVNSKGNLQVPYGVGTNWYYGFKKVLPLLNKDPHRRKCLVFLTDGKPERGSRKGSKGDNEYFKKNLLFTEDDGFFTVTGKIPKNQNEARSSTCRKAYANKVIDYSNENITNKDNFDMMYNVYIGKTKSEENAKSQNNTEFNAYEFFHEFSKHIGYKNNNHKSKSYNGDNKTNLEDALNDITSNFIKRNISHSNVTIHDALSEYAEFDVKNNNIVDLKVAAYDDASGKCIKTYDASKVKFNIKEKEITWKIPDADLNPLYTYRMEFKIIPTQKAFDEFAKLKNEGKEAPHTGDKDTGKDSENKKGFYSNAEDKAYVSYQVKSVYQDGNKFSQTTISPERTTNYHRPILTVPASYLYINKLWGNGAENHMTETVKYIVLQDGKEYSSGELTKSNDWKDTVIVPAGIKGHKYVIKEELDRDYLVSYAIRNTEKDPLKFEKGIQTSEIDYNDARNEPIEHKRWVTLQNEQGISVSVEKQWDDDKATDRPKSVEVELQYSDGKKVDNQAITNPIRLNKDNGWTHRWKNLAKDKEYQVVELNVPEGYQASITEDVEEAIEKVDIEQLKTTANEFGVIPVTHQNTYRKTEFYHPGPLGTLGGFHLVGFEEIVQNNHINGNICTKLLTRKCLCQNFGTNKLKEISYVRKFGEGFDDSNPIMACGFLAEQQSILVVGKDRQIGTEWNGPTKTIDNVTLDTPNHPISLWQDTEVPFVDLEAEKSRAQTISRDLAEYTTKNIEVDRNDRFNLNIKLKNPDGINVIKLTPEDCKDKQYINIMGYDRNKKATVLINMDLKGKDITIPGTRLYYCDKIDPGNINENRVPWGEVNEWQNANLVWNFYDSTKTDKIYKGTINSTGFKGKNYEIAGVLLAPNATVRLNSVLNGSVIANKVIVNCESHRTDFTGEKLYPGKHFIITNTKKDEMDYHLPNTGRMFGETIYWMFGSAIVFVAIDLMKKRL